MKLMDFIDLRVSVIGAIFCMLAALTACSEPSKPEVDISRPVKMLTVGGSNQGIRLEYPGVVAAVKTVTLGFEVPGKIIDFPIIEGQDVKKDDLLGRLDPEDYRAERDSAASHRQAMDAAYKRAKNIFDQNAGSQADVDNALRNIQVANEDLKKVQKALNDTYLKAPFSGQIAETYVDNFQNVQAKEPVVIMHDLDTLKIEVTVPEIDMALSKSKTDVDEYTKRMQPEVSISALSDNHFPAVLYSFTTSADPATRTYIASFRFSNTSEHSILPGMTAKLSILADSIRNQQHDTIKIPVKAVIPNAQKQPSVWRINPNSMQVTQIQVKLGDMFSQYVHVLDGLSAGDRIAISGVHYLREGMKVHSLPKQTAK
ncbi:efflux RND transporter periplasmic adaptor subunit [uncultured Nitrosomonas sp.]|uniref:efflux RND transporter periplasmic adaptor subunit n=1 Tax=uncultured Nitrosomonas sp. TaxID=156424 RepID=UPI0025F4C6C5|nr:efflux RND transporter periplasmic adaptor subunit [uncultured Nitrosomonas sp.]